MRTILEIIGTAVVVGLAGGAVGYLVRKNVAEGKIATAEEQAIRIVQDAEQTGEAKRKEIMMEAKEEIHRLRSDMERENKDINKQGALAQAILAPITGGAAGAAFGGGLH